MLACLVGFVVAAQVSVAGVYRSSRPDIALMAAPFDAGARSKLAERLVASSGDPATARNFAQDAIRRDALQPIALRTLGQTESADGSELNRDAMALMLQSQRLSRRDLPTQIWLIDYFGKVGDPQAVVRHIDLALRVSVPARSSLFPLLVAAASDAETRKIIIRTLAMRPNWATLFAVYATEGGANLDFAVEVARLLFDARLAEGKARFNTLLRRLVDGGRYELAWDVFSDPALGLKGNDSVVRNGGFESRGDSSPFEWIYTEEAELSSFRERLRGGSFVLRAASYNGRGGAVARQIVHLTRGSHFLRARVGDIPADPFERPELKIECLEPLGTIPLLIIKPNVAGERPQVLQGRFSVPSNCSFQQITISVAGDGSAKEFYPWVDDISIER